MAPSHDQTAAVPDPPDQAAHGLAAMGWGSFFADQLQDADLGLRPMRVARVHRAHITALSVNGPERLGLPAPATTGDYAVGDWVLVEGDETLVARRLRRRTLLERRTEGGRQPQLIAANIDTLFIVTSCNADLNLARLERYLALANEAGITPVVVLTKADTVDDPAAMLSPVEDLQRDLTVVAVDAKSPATVDVLSRWCGPGQTVALVGSSGVGKSTLLNTLAGKSAADGQKTGEIRAGDAKGRHTTTARSLHRIAGGGWAIDTPGIRSLQVSDITVGLDRLFAEIAELAPSCRFRDCTHGHEPGCAVQAAVAAGRLDPARLERWRKLDEENRDNTPVISGPRGNRKAAPPPRRR